MQVNRIIADAGLIALTDCVCRCPFGAREIVEGALLDHPARCYGCGLCVGACPTEAIELKSQLDEFGLVVLGDVQIPLSKNVQMFIGRKNELEVLKVDRSRVCGAQIPTDRRQTGRTPRALLAD